MVTRKVLVVKKWGFPAQNGDENGLRRQKIGFLTQKCRREKVLVAKNQWKMGRVIHKIERL
ncbi:hypothetical protein NSQ82_16955 [Caldifermentibacillus hisashii]|uniref:hypothetical protein n=1 Tax=Caldifermentibacillus hisashii TaxID=996558 RepID=UPI0031B72FCF